MTAPLQRLFAEAPTGDLEQPLVRVESQLAELALALRSNDSQALETAASELHRALAAAVDHFRTAARPSSGVSHASLNGHTGGFPSTIAPVAFIRGPSSFPLFSRSRSAIVEPVGPPMSRTAVTPCAMNNGPYVTAST